MFFQLLFIHLYRPFLKYTRSTSPLPSHVSPRKFCTQAAAAISKLFRLYKRTHGLRQICNIAVYIAHSACTIHLLNLPDKNARRDIIHGVKHLEEIGDCWTCARRTLRILALSAEKWKVELPDEALAAFARTRARWGVPEPTSVSPTNTHVSLDVPARPSVISPTETTFRPLQIAPAPQPRPIQPVATSLTQAQNGLTQRPISFPADTEDARRSSGGYSLPPQAAADVSRLPNKPKSTVQLTKQQQDAWNTHRLNQARKSSLSNTAANANMLFGGVDSLIGSEDSQDWWLKDQSSIAHGFDNWVDPNIDWSSMGLDIPDELSGNSNGSGYQPMSHNGAPHSAGRTNGFSAHPANVPQSKQGLSIRADGLGQQYGHANSFDENMYF